MKADLEQEIKRSKVDQAKLEEKLLKELEDANVDVKDKRLSLRFEKTDSTNAQG